MKLSSKKELSGFYNKGRKQFLITSIRILIAQNNVKAFLNDELERKQTKTLEKLYKNLQR